MNCGSGEPAAIKVKGGDRDWNPLPQNEISIKVVHFQQQNEFAVGGNR